MSTADLTVYRSTDPEVLRRWHDTKAAVEAWGDKLKAALHDLGMGDRQVWYDQISGRLMGLARGEGETPDGWRIDRRTGYLVPRLTTKAGKEIGAKLSALRRPDPRDLIGMPKHVFVSLSLLTCGLKLLDGALYVHWSQPIPEDEVDLTLWERVRLSEYYAVVEREEAAELAGSPS